MKNRKFLLSLAMLVLSMNAWATTDHPCDANVQDGYPDLGPPGAIDIRFSALCWRDTIADAQIPNSFILAQDGIRAKMSPLFDRLRAARTAAANASRECSTQAQRDALLAKITELENDMPSLLVFDLVSAIEEITSLVREADRLVSRGEGYVVHHPEGEEFGFNFTDAYRGEHHAAAARLYRRVEADKAMIINRINDAFAALHSIEAQLTAIEQIIVDLNSCSQVPDTDNEDVSPMPTSPPTYYDYYSEAWDIIESQTPSDSNYPDDDDELFHNMYYNPEEPEPMPQSSPVPVEEEWDWESIFQ